MYDYKQTMNEDIRDHIRENYTQEEITEKLRNRDEWESELNDELWIDDAVTGNASGSYTFNSWKAQEYVNDNSDLLREALREFCTDGDTIAEKFLDGEWEYFDVTIRCYLLGSVLSDVLDELEEEFSEELENSEKSESAFDDFCAKFHGCDGCPFENLHTLDECKQAFRDQEEAQQ